jgi:hypothetical protein
MMFLAYCNCRGDENLWDNALKETSKENNKPGYTSLGSDFLEDLPMLVKPYVYKPGLKIKVPKIDETTGGEVQRNGRTVYQTVRSVEADGWKSKIDNLKVSIQVGLMLQSAQHIEGDNAYLTITLLQMNTATIPIFNTVTEMQWPDT